MHEATLRVKRDADSGLVEFEKERTVSRHEGLVQSTHHETIHFDPTLELARKVTVVEHLKTQNLNSQIHLDAVRVTNRSSVPNATRTHEVDPLAGTCAWWTSIRAD